MKRNIGLDGFMLIELIVATLIASLISVALLTALSQGNRSQLLIDNTIDVFERISIVANQLEKDLVGAFVPTQAEKDGDKDTEPADTTSGNEKKGDEKKASPAKKDEQSSKDTDKKDKEHKPIEKIFYSTNKEGMLDTLTFVTNNPLTVFVSKDVGVVKPKAVRVQYTLKPEPGKKDSYALFRQESNQLDLAEYKNVRPYEVIGGVKKCTVKFVARTEKKESSSAKADTAKEKPKIAYEYKEMAEWVSEQKKDTSKDADTKAEFPRIPYKVECALTLWDQRYRKDKDFVLVFEIPVDSLQAKKEEKKQPEMAAKDEKQPPAAGDKKPAQGQQQAKVNSNPANSAEVVVYNGIETLSHTLNNLTKMLKQM